MEPSTYDTREKQLFASMGHTPRKGISSSDIRQSLLGRPVPQSLWKVTKWGTRKTGAFSKALDRQPRRWD